MSSQGWNLRQRWYRYADPNTVAACYLCSRGTNTYVSAARSERFQAHNGLVLNRPADTYQIPLCQRCLTAWDIRRDPEEDPKPAREETPKVVDDSVTWTLMPGT